MESKLTQKEKFELIYLLKNKYPQLEIRYMCKVATVSKSGYYSYVKRQGIPSSKQIQDEEDFEKIKRAYDFKRRSKGARTIKMTLKNEFHTIMNIKKIRRLMKKFNLYCPIRKANPYRRMSKAMATNAHYENKVDRKFNRDVAGLIFLTDITYLKYGGKTAYLSTVKDACTKEIVAYQVSQSLEIPFVIDTIKGLLSNEKIVIQPEAIIHSDQGCHYTSYAYQALLKENHIQQSMSRRGNCWDNAPQESFYGHMKDELNLEECNTFEDLNKEIDDYMNYYNNHRYQWNLNRMTPSQYREYKTNEDVLYLKGENHFRFSPVN